MPICALPWRRLCSNCLQFLSSGKGLARLNYQSNSGSFLSLNGHRSELRDTHDVYSLFLEVAASDRNGLYGLIDGAGADGLNFRAIMLPHHAGDCAGDGRGS